MKSFIETTVETFFRNFALQHLQAAGIDSTNTKAVKETLLNQYEHIFATFAENVSPLLAAGLRAGTPEVETAESLQNTLNQLAHMERLQWACGNSTHFNTMVAKYKQCFSMLLEGRIP